VVNYTDAFIAEVVDIQKAIASGAVTCRIDCTPKLLARIQAGALSSLNTPKPVKKLVASYLGR
jgi:hypothetical protein